MVDAKGGSRSAGPDHLRLRMLGLVAAGGALGTGLRQALSLWLPPVHGLPLTTAGINVVGAFALGLLLEVLAPGRADPQARHRLRLFVGTGILGGFTTYSALAVDTVLVGSDLSPTMAAAYALGTLAIGVGAAVLGVLVGVRLRRGTPR